MLAEIGHIDTIMMGIAMVVGVAMAVEFAMITGEIVINAKHSGPGLTGTVIAGHHHTHLEVNVMPVQEGVHLVLIHRHVIVVKQLTHSIIQTAINAAVFRTSL